MDEDSLSRICVTAFSSEEIVSAKKLLFDSIPSGQKLKIRKGEKKSQRDIDDIITLLKRTDPEFVPVFVARDLQKLPPITFDHVDVTRLLKDILLLKKELQVVKDSYVTIESFNAMQRNVDVIKTTITSINDEYCNINLESDCHQQNEYHCESEPVELHYSSPSSPKNINKHSINTLGSPNEAFVNSNQEINMKPCDGMTNVQNSINNICAPSKPRMVKQVADMGAVNAMTNEAKDIPSNAQTKPPMLRSPLVRAKSPMSHTGASSAQSKQQISQPITRATLADIVKAPGEWKVQNTSEEWKVVQKKRFRNIIVGKTGAAAAEPQGKFKAAQINIPLFVYNVDKSTTLQDISAYVYKMSQMQVTINKLSMKSDKGYDAYKVFVPRHKLDQFLNENFWPEGILFRRFVDFAKPKVKDKEEEHTTNG